MKCGVIFVLLVLVQTVLCSNIAGVRTTEAYERSDILDADGNYILFWNFNDTHVTFETHVRTKGWVGLGMSGNGNMFPGDVAVGWVLNNGTVRFSDRHTEGHRMPVTDKSQDWHLLYGEENEFGTILKFVRQIDTCDDAEDLKITEGTTRLIFAYGENDPADNNSIMYHGTKRGTKSVSLLLPSTAKNNLPANVRHFDFLNNNFLVPSAATTYWCRGFKMPNIGKHHMIKYEALVTPGNELNVHHILLYRCKVNNPDQYDSKASTCYDKNRILPYCSNMIAAWAIGGEPFYFPDDVGFSVGGPDDEIFYIMEMHYDNPTQKSGMIDNSGIRFTLTPSLRKHEAGMMQFGHWVSSSQIIPPGRENFLTQGHCSQECMKEGFKQSNVSEIRFIGAVQHSHLIGVGMTTRHFRNGTELKPLLDDPNYDFNFQAVRVLPKEVVARPGDSFRVDCTYDSTTRSGVTLGGLSTREEMCLTFAYYYPKIKLESCKSEPTLDAFSTDRQNLYHELSMLDWTNKTSVDWALSKINKSRIRQDCSGEHFQQPVPQLYHPSYPVNSYIPPAATCT